MDRLEHLRSQIAREKSLPPGLIHAGGSITSVPEWRVRILNVDVIELPAFCVVQIDTDVDISFPPEVLRARRPTVDNANPSLCLVTLQNVPVGQQGWANMRWPSLITFTQGFAAGLPVGTVKDSFGLSTSKNGFILSATDSVDGYAWITPYKPGVIDGDGPPDPGDGGPGDYYIDHQGTGAWPVGAQGPEGGVGPDGPDGSQGPTGDDGSIGSQGYIGVQGYRGVQGYVGPQGPSGSYAGVHTITYNTAVPGGTYTEFFSAVPPTGMYLLWMAVTLSAPYAGTEGQFNWGVTTRHLIPAGTVSTPVVINGLTYYYSNGSDTVSFGIYSAFGNPTVYTQDAYDSVGYTKIG